MIIATRDGIPGMVPETAAPLRRMPESAVKVIEKFAGSLGCLGQCATCIMERVVLQFGLALLGVVAARDNAVCLNEERRR
jgi:hypothetical protein